MNTHDFTTLTSGVQLTFPDYRVGLERDEQIKAYIIDVVQKSFADKRSFEYKHPKGLFDYLLVKIGLGNFAKYETVTFVMLYPNIKPAVADWIIHV